MTNTPPSRAMLRRRYRDSRRRLSAATRQANAVAVARHFCAGRLALGTTALGLYLTNDADGELSTLPLLARLLATGRRLALPVTGRRGRMEFYHYRADTGLVENRYGILEPAPGATHVPPLALRLLLVPLVAFDERGARLGMGAGYYDRYVARIPASMRPRLVGLAHDCQRSVEPLPEADWDARLDGVITERGWRQFAARPRAQSRRHGDGR